MKIAVIDIGTNTFKLMICRVNEHGNFVLIDKAKIPVKLGEGGFPDGNIAETAFDRGIQSLNKLQQKIVRFQVDKTLAFATSAIRSSKNGKEFVRKVKESTGIQIQVIDGDREAELIYYGVRKALDIGSENALIMDIGGGSTEFILANSHQIWWKHSFDLGSSRLIREVNPSDPITKEEIRHLKEHLQKELSMLWAACEIYPVNIMIGSSGSFDSLAEMIWHRFHTEENPLVKTEYHFNLEHFDAIYKSLINSSIEKRFKMKGLAPMRVEMIVVAVIMIRFVLKQLKLSKLTLSTYSLKEGILFDYLQKK